MYFKTDCDKCLMGAVRTLNLCIQPDGITVHFNLNHTEVSVFVRDNWTGDSTINVYRQHNNNPFWNDKD